MRAVALQALRSMVREPARSGRDGVALVVRAAGPLAIRGPHVPGNGVGPEAGLVQEVERKWHELSVVLLCEHLKEGRHRADALTVVLEGYFLGDIGMRNLASH